MTREEEIIDQINSLNSELYSLRFRKSIANKYVSKCYYSNARYGYPFAWFRCDYVNDESYLCGLYMEITRNNHDGVKSVFIKRDHIEYGNPENTGWKEISKEDFENMLIDVDNYIEGC